MNYPSQAKIITWPFVSDDLPTTRMCVTLFFIYAFSRHRNKTTAKKIMKGMDLRGVYSLGWDDFPVMEN